MPPKEKPKGAPPALPGPKARESLSGGPRPSISKAKAEVGKAQGPPPRRSSVAPKRNSLLPPDSKTPPRPSKRASLQVLGKVAALGAAAKAKRKASPKTRSTIAGIPGEVTPPRSQDGSERSEPDDEPEDQPHPPPKQMAFTTNHGEYMANFLSRGGTEAGEMTPRTLASLREENTQLQAGIESRDSMITDLNRRVSISEGAQESMQRNLVPKVNELIDRFERREEDQAVRMQECEEHNQMLQEELHGFQSQALQQHRDRVPQVHTSELEAELNSCRNDELLAVEAMSRARAQLADKKEAMEEISELTEQGMVEARAKLDEALRESAMHEENAVIERRECENLLAEVHTFRSEGIESKSPGHIESQTLDKQGDVQLGAPWLSRWARLAVMVRLDCWGEVMGEVLCQAAIAPSRSRNSTSRDVSVSGDMQEGDMQAFDSMLANVQDVKASLVSALQETEAECAWWERQARFHEAKAASRLKDIDEVKVKEERFSKQILALKMQVTALRSQLSKSKIDLSGLTGNEQVEAVIAQEKSAMQDAEDAAARSMVEQFVEARSVSEELERVKDMEQEEASALIKVRDELQAYMDGQEAVLAGPAIQPLLEEIQEAREVALRAIQENDDDGLVMEAQTCRLYSQISRSSAELKELRLEMEAAQQASREELEQVREDLNATWSAKEETSTSELMDELNSSTKALASLELEKDELQEALVMGVMDDAAKDDESEVRQLSSSLAAQNNILKKAETELTDLRAALVSGKKKSEEVEEAKDRAEAAAESRGKAMHEVMAEVRELQVLKIEEAAEAKFAQDSMQKTLAEMAERAKQEAEQEVALEASRLEVLAASRIKEGELKEELAQESFQSQENLAEEASMLEAAAEQQREELISEASALQAAAYQQEEGLAEEACKIEAAVVLQAEQLELEEAKVQELEVSNCSLRMALATAEDAQETMTSAASDAEICRLRSEAEELRDVGRSKEELQEQTDSLKSSPEKRDREGAVKESERQEGVSKAYADAQAALQSSELTPSIRASLVRFKASLEIAETETKASMKQAEAEVSARIHTDAKLRQTEFELQLATKTQEATTAELNQCLRSGAAVGTTKVEEKTVRTGRGRAITFSDDLSFAEKDEQAELDDACAFAMHAAESRDEALMELSESLTEGNLSKAVDLLSTVQTEVAEEKTETAIANRIIRAQNVASVALKVETEAMKAEDAALREELTENALSSNRMERALQKSELVACTAERARDEALTELDADSGSAASGAHGGSQTLAAVRTLILRIEVGALLGRPASNATAPSSLVTASAEALLRSSHEDSLFVASPTEVAALRLQLEDEMASKTQIVALRSALQKRIEEGMDPKSEYEERSILQNTAGVSPSLQLGRQLQAHFTNKDRWAEEVKELKDELAIEAAKVQYSEEMASVVFAEMPDIDWTELQMYMSGTDDPKLGESVCTTAMRAAMSAQAAAIRSAAHFNTEASRLHVELKQLVESLPGYDGSGNLIEALASLLKQTGSSIKPFQLKIDLEKSVSSIRDAQEAALYAVDCISFEADTTQFGQITQLRKALQLLSREFLKHIEEFQRLRDYSSENKGAIAGFIECGDDLQKGKEDTLQLQSSLEPAQAGHRVTPPPNNEILLLHFPNAAWPTPANFQEELRKGIIALGSRHMAGVVIRLHEGSGGGGGGIIAELVGSRVAITELRGMPLMDLMILNFPVGLVRSSRPMLTEDADERSVLSPSRIMPSSIPRGVERELLGELQAAEMKAEVLLEASKADDIEFDELTTRLEVEEHAFQGSKDACAELSCELESSQRAVQEGVEQAESQVLIYDAELQKEELRTAQLRLVVQDMAGTEISTHNELRGKLSVEESQVARFKQQLASLEGWSADPRDTSRSAFSIGNEIADLMHRQGLAARGMSETIAMDGDPVRLAVAASHMASLADQTVDKVATIKQLLTDAELRFSEALRQQRQISFNWEVVAEQRQTHNEHLQATLDNPAPSVLDDELRTEMSRCAQWEVVAGENEELVAHLHLARQEAERGKALALAEEARMKHVIHEERLQETVQALAVAQVVEESVSAATTDASACKSSDLGPSEFMEAIQVVAESEIREATRARQMSARMASEEESVVEMRAQILGLLDNAKEAGALRKETHELKQLVHATQSNEMREIESTRELAVQLSAEQIFATQLKSEISSLKSEIAQVQPEMEALHFQLAERNEVCEDLRDAARDQMMQVDSKNIDIQWQMEACVDLEVVTDEMQTQIDLLTRRLTEHECSSMEFERTTEAELLQVKAELRWESRMEIEEADQFQREAAQCHSMSVEVAAALAGHATALCDAKLSAAKATADHDEESEKLSALASREVCMARELADAKLDLEEEIEKQVYEEERWEMLIARHEGRAQVLHDVATDRDNEISELRTRLYAEERSCWMVEKATEDALCLGDQTARISEVKTELKFLSEAELASERSVQAKLYAEIEELKLSLATKAYDEDLAAAQAHFTGAFLHEVDVPAFGEDISNVEDRAVGSGHSSPLPLEVKAVENTEEIQLLQTLASERLQEAEAAEVYAQERYEEMQRLSSFGVNEPIEDYDVSQAWVDLLSADAPDREPAFTAIEDENAMVGAELQQVMAELQGLHEEVRTPSAVFPGLSTSDGRIESPREPRDRSLSPGRRDSPSNIHDVSTLAQRAQQLAHATAVRHQEQLQVLSSECNHWKECSSRHEAISEHLKDSIEASTVEARELGAFLALEEIAWQSLREATRAKGTQELYEQFELEGVCAQLKQQQSDLAEQNKKLSLELDEASMEHELTREADLEEALSRVAFEAEKTSVALEVQLQDEICQIANVKARCREELQTEARTCRESTEQMHTFMNDMQQETSELMKLHRLRDERTEMAEAQEEKMALAVQSETVENQQCATWMAESAELSTTLFSELQKVKEDHELQKENSEAKQEELSTFLEKLEVVHGEKQEAAYRASTFHAEVVKLRTELQSSIADSNHSESVVLQEVQSLLASLSITEQHVEDVASQMTELQAEIAEKQRASVEAAILTQEARDETQNLFWKLSAMEVDKEEAVAKISALEGEIVGLQAAALEAAQAVQTMKEEIVEQEYASAEAVSDTRAARDETQNLFWKLSAMEVDKEEVVARVSELEGEMVELNSAFDEAVEAAQAMYKERSGLHERLLANDVDKEEAICKASECHAEIVKLRTSSSEAAHTTQETTANMRSQVTDLFEQLDAWGAECASLEKVVLTEEAIAAEWATSHANVLSRQRHEASESRSVRIMELGSSEMSELISSYSESSGKDTHTAWTNLEGMLEDSTTIALVDNSFLTCELDHRCSRLQSELEEARKTCIPHPAFSKLVVQMEALKNSKDRLYAAWPDKKAVEDREYQHERCKGMLLSLLPKVTSLVAQVNELRESRDLLLAEQHSYRSTLAIEFNDELCESRDSLHAEHQQHRCNLARELDDELRESRESMLRHESQLADALASEHRQYRGKLDDELRESRESTILHESKLADALSEELRESRDSMVTQSRYTDSELLNVMQENVISELQAELRRSQSELESLEQVAELHAQHSLKVHRLMCEDQHQRLTSDRSMGGQRYPARSGALRSWQASLADQSQALLERSWQLLNNSASTMGAPATLALQPPESSIRSADP